MLDRIRRPAGAALAAATALLTVTALGLLAPAAPALAADTASGRLWAFANYSRYVHPGAARIAATSSSSAVDLAAFKNTDGTVTIANASYNGSIAAGGNTSVGFQGSWASSDAVPTAFTLNGASCTT